MIDVLLNILTLGIKPFYEKQMKFHDTIVDFRDKLSSIEAVSLTVTDIEGFYNKLNNFDFRFVLFAKYYRKYIDNLNRFKPETKGETPDLTFLLLAIAEDKWKPTKPFHVFIHYVKYKYKLTAKFFIAHQKKQNLKKLNSPGELAKHNSKFDSSAKWTRIPIRQDQCKPGCGCSQ